MLINLYDINLNYVKMVSEEDLGKKENKDLFHKIIQLHIFDNDKKLIVPALLNVEKSETIKEVIINYFREKVGLVEVAEKQIQIVYLEALIKDPDFDGNVFLYNVGMYLNKSQTKKLIDWTVKNA